MYYDLSKYGQNRQNRKDGRKSLKLSKKSKNSLIFIIYFQFIIVLNNIIQKYIICPIIVIIVALSSKTLYLDFWQMVLLKVVHLKFFAPFHGHFWTFPILLSKLELKHSRVELWLIPRVWPHRVLAVLRTKMGHLKEKIKCKQTADIHIEM